MRRRNLIITLLIVVVLILVFVALLAFTYNQLSKADKLVNDRWILLEQELRERYKLIPGFTAMARKHAPAEEGILGGVMEAQVGFLKSETVNARAGAANQLEEALGRLLLLAELYPRIPADKDYGAKTKKLWATQDRIAPLRVNYNLAAQQYNQTAKAFPNSLFVRLLGFDPEKVSFKEIAKVKKAPEKIKAPPKKKVRIKTMG